MLDLLDLFGLQHSEQEQEAERREKEGKVYMLPLENRAAHLIKEKATGAELRRRRS